MTMRTPAELISEMRGIATSARLDANLIAGPVRDLVRSLADAVDLSAELLEQQQAFLIRLRNHKQDAPQ